jgi:2,3-diketo-5-methylthio-1-phosphopentane phosphatase
MIIKKIDIPFKVICDFDGTISKNDTFDQLLERYADPQWQNIEADWLNGKIGTGECMSKQMALVNVEKAELDDFLSRIQIDINFIRFVKFCRNLNIEISIASDGVDYLIKSILKNYKLDFLKFSSNKLVFKDNNKYQLEFKKKSDLCDSGSMVCKCSIAQAEKGNKKIIYVGDGYSDLCVSNHVDLVIAKSTLLAHCVKNQLPHYPFYDFSDVQSIIKNLIKNKEIITSRKTEKEKLFFKNLNS